MSGKHDKSVDDEQSSNLLLTGPIAIRGLGRGVKDALVRGRPSRHRAFADEPSEHDVHPAPLQQMLAVGPAVLDPGPSSDLAEHAVTQATREGGASFRQSDQVSETDGDGLQEDRVNRPGETARPADPGIEPSLLEAAAAERIGDAASLSAGSQEQAHAPGVTHDGAAASDGETDDRPSPEAPPESDAPANEVVVAGLVDVQESQRARERPTGPAAADSAPATSPPDEPGRSEPAVRASADPSEGAGSTDADVQGAPHAATADEGSDPLAESMSADATEDRGRLEDPEDRGTHGAIGASQPIERDRWSTAEELFGLPLVRPVSAPRAPKRQPASLAPEASEGENALTPEPGHSRFETVPAFGADQSRSPSSIGLNSAADEADAVHVEAPAAGRSPRVQPRSEPRGPLLFEFFNRQTVGIAVLLVLALVCAGLVTAVVVKTRNDAVTAASEAARYTPPPLATPQPGLDGPAIAVIGDGTTAEAASRVTGKQRWTSLVASSMRGTVRADASTGMGYAAKSAAGDTFVLAASRVPSNAQVVVFFGGAADADIAALSLAKAATAAFATAKERAPRAKILVVGPVLSSGPSGADVTSVRTTLRAAALVVKATWVDPLDKGWLPAARQTVSPQELSSSDEKAIASKMRVAVEKVLR